MGFRFYNFNAIYRSYISTLSTKSNRTYYHPIFQSLNSQFSSPSSNFSNQHYLKIPVRWHLGHAHDHHDHRHQFSGKEAENIFRLGLFSDIGLAIGKALTGYVSGSTAIIADAAHSISDVVIYSFLSLLVKHFPSMCFCFIYLFYCRFSVGLHCGHSKRQMFLKTKNIHMVTFNLYLHAAP